MSITDGGTRTKWYLKRSLQFVTFVTPYLDVYNLYFFLHNYLHNQVTRVSTHFWKRHYRVLFLCGFCYYRAILSYWINEFSLKKLEFFLELSPIFVWYIYCKWQVCFLLGLKQQKLWNIQFYCLHFWDFLNMFNLLLTILKVFINDQIRQYTYKEFAHLHNIVNVMSIVSDRSHKYAPTVWPADSGRNHLYVSLLQNHLGKCKDAYFVR